MKVRVRHREREAGFIETFGIRGLISYLIGVIQGYLRGFLWEHKFVRRAGWALLLVSVFVAVFIGLSLVAPSFQKFPQNREMDPVIARAAEEKPDLETEKEAPAILQQIYPRKESAALQENVIALAEPGEKEKETREVERRGDRELADIAGNLTDAGGDQPPLQIMDVKIDDFKVSNVDKPVPVTVTISVRNDEELTGQLTFAFLPEGETPDETDWKKEASFQTEITKNGGWIAYCRDRIGNMATKRKELIAVDSKRPTVGVILEKEEWCQENRIFVSAEDSLPVEYRYVCESAGEDSGWIGESSKTVNKNGVWMIQVRDEAGNVAEQEIEVKNIDTQAPVIRGITEKSEGETGSNEE